MHTLINLTQYEFIRAAGPDARSFLQGQVTCDTTKISTTQSVRGALCNLKGRVIADFRALQIEEDILLQVTAGLGATVLAVLKKYAVFSKLTLTLDDSLLARGLMIDVAQTEAAALPQENGAASSLAHFAAVTNTGASAHGIRAFEFWGGAAALDEATAPFLQYHTETSELSWVDLENLSGIAHVSHATSEAFTPALLNYDIAGVVDFKKGCYTGQEIVARMFYRSTPKKRLFALSSDEPLGNEAAFGEVGNPANIEALSVAPHSLLAVLAIDAENLSFEARSPTGSHALELITLSY